MNIYSFSCIVEDITERDRCGKMHWAPFLLGGSEYPRQRQRVMGLCVKKLGH